MTDQSVHFPQFYMTLPAPCPYLPDRQERKVFTELSGHDAAALNDALSLIGFRRSQRVAYRPACEDCAACLSVRIPVEDFRPDRRMRRIKKLNADLIEQVTPAWVTDEQFLLLRDYIDARHASGGMADMDLYDFTAMVEDTAVDTQMVEYRLRNLDDPDAAPSRLLAACLTDVMDDGLSMIYSFYAPDQTARSLGTLMILAHIERTRRLGLAYVYLGYWIENCRKMSYKADFQPLEAFRGERWVRLAPPTARRHQRDPS
jgi:arginine-tRNA-protein transferase